MTCWSTSSTLKSAFKGLNQYGLTDKASARGTERRLFGPGVSLQTGFSKCLLRVFTFNLMHLDDTESKHIHTESLHRSSLLAHSM